jgi:phosphoserine phosphatase
MPRSERSRRSLGRRAAPWLCLLPFVCPEVRGAPDGARGLDPSLPWAADNRQRLEELIKKHGRTSPTYRRERPPVATFDMDNTLIKNDLGDGTVSWALRHDKVLQPPRKDWRLVNHFLTPAGTAALKAACDGAAEAGRPLPTATDARCATEILTVYLHSRTTAGQPAFGPCEHRRMEPAYAFGVQLLGGHTKAEVRSYAAAALDEALAAPAGSTRSVGAVRGLAAWIRIYAQQRDLIAALREAGFDVWIVSASPQPVAEIGGERLGVPADHVIGIRLLERDGRYSYDLAGCGDVPDGRNTGTANVGNGVISYIEGKRCFINQVIFGREGAEAFQRPSDRALRPAFAAGDAETDLAMLQDAGLRLVIDRNQPELMCNALRNAHGSWLVNPMFIEPLKPRLAPYPCATAVCKDGGGAPIPCRDEDGAPIPDQPGSGERPIGGAR